MNEKQKQLFENDYMPYIVKWGKLTCWLSIPLILLPSIALMIFYGAKFEFGSFLTALIPLLSSMAAWYVVDPVTLFPVLHVPGLYMTYIAGNSKEVRAPAAIAAMSAAGVEAGTEHGTVISCIAIATSVFVSLACLTFVAVAGNVLLSIMPPVIITALNFLLPALYGSMCMQRVLLDVKTSIIMIPITVFVVFLARIGVFAGIPIIGGCAQLVILVICGGVIAKAVHKKELTSKD